MIRALTLLVVVALPRPATPQPLDLDTIGKHPGTRVIKRMENNAEVVEINRGGVTITIDGGREDSVDSSGKAVFCYWDLAVEAKISLDLCYPDEFPELSQKLAEQIDFTNAFIVANSLRPISKTRLEKMFKDRLARTAAGIKMAGIPAAESLFCRMKRRNDLVPVSQKLAWYHREYLAALDVPRPPARRPCN